MAMLADLCDFYKVRELDMPVKGFRPFPRYGDRGEWEAAAPETARRWIAAAEGLLAYEWPPVLAQMYIRPRATGEFGDLNRRFRERRDALGFLAFAECFEGKGRFVEQIVNGIVAICEETSWSQVLAFAGIGFDIPLPSDHEVDLTTSETAAQLALIDYLLGERLDQASGRVRRRLRGAVKERALDTYLSRDDYWWMGFEKGHRVNNWNPWCNLNAIICFLLLCDDAQARARGLHRAILSLDRYMEDYAGDGCCDEGPMYWGAAGAGLFDCLELLRQASGGAIDAIGLDKLRLIGEYIAKAHIHGDWYVNYADGDAIVKNGSSTYRFGKALGNAGMMALGARGGPLLPVHRDWFSTYAFLNEIFTERERAECRCAPPHAPLAWFGEKQVMVARERGGSEKGLFLSVKAGYNAESHNHNDVGSFIVYADGSPLLIDIGTEEYRAQTFNERRYELWYTQSQFHSCPGARGALQHVGAEYRASGVVFEQAGGGAGCCGGTGESAGGGESSGAGSGTGEDAGCGGGTGDGATLSMELRGAYPEDAGIVSLKRTVSLSGGAVRLRDSFLLDEATDEIFQYFMAARRPVDMGGGKIAFAKADCRTAIMRYDADLMGAEIEEYPLSESRLRRNWGDALYRVVLRAKKPAKALESAVSIFISDADADAGAEAGTGAGAKTGAEAKVRMAIAGTEAGTGTGAKAGTEAGAGAKAGAGASAAAKADADAGAAAGTGAGAKAKAHMAIAGAEAGHAQG